MREAALTARKSRTRTAERGVTWAAVRKLARSFPGMTEGSSCGEPAFLLDGMLARLERLPRAEFVALDEGAFRAKAKKKRLAEYEAKKAR